MQVAETKFLRWVAYIKRWNDDVRKQLCMFSTCKQQRIAPSGVTIYTGSQTLILLKKFGAFFIEYKTTYNTVFCLKYEYQVTISRTPESKRIQQTWGRNSEWQNECLILEAHGDDFIYMLNVYNTICWDEIYATGERSFKNW